jgi:fucose 4-O-acetylase-like acetyltransferase
LGKITENSGESRNYLFDNIKAVLIFSVVIAHYFRASASFDLPTFGGIVHTIALSYIMQGFLFVSGYFSRNLEKCRSTAFRSFLFPYMVLMPVMFCVRYLIFGKAHFDLTLPTMALWYLITLFFYRYFLKDLVSIGNILPVSIAVSLAAGSVPVLDSTLSLGRTFSFLPFFLMGYYFKEEWIEKLRRVPKAAAWLLLTVLLGLSAYAALHRIIPSEALYMKAPYESTGLTIEQGIAVRAVIMLISLAWIYIFIALLSERRTFLTRIGQNTMTIYVLHIIIRYVVKGIDGIFRHEVLTYVTLTVIAAVSVFLFSRPAIAQKYDHFINTMYRWAIKTPQALVRRIL